MLSVESPVFMRVVFPSLQLLPVAAALSLAFATHAAHGASGQDDLTAGDEKVM